MDRRRRRLVVLGAACALSMAFLLVVDMADSDDGFSLLGLLLTLLDILPLIATNVATVLLVFEVLDQREATAALSRDVEEVRERSRVWREEAAAQLRDLGGAIQRQLIVLGADTGGTGGGVAAAQGFQPP